MKIKGKKREKEKERKRDALTTPPAFDFQLRMLCFRRFILLFVTSVEQTNAIDLNL